MVESPGLFRIGHPGAGWHLESNRRIGSRYLVGFRRDGEDVDLRVTVHPLDDATRRMPLPALAEAMVRNFGRTRALTNEIAAVQRVDFGAHEGVVVHARRSWKKVERPFAQAFVRAGGRLLMITYMAPPGSFDRYAADVSTALDRFAILLPPDPPSWGLVLPNDLPTRHESVEGPFPVSTPSP